MSKMSPEVRAAARAAAALKSVARDEHMKAYVASEAALHDTLLRAAMRFIGGEQLEECLETAQELNGKGYATSIDYMGESTRDARMAEEATQEFERVIDAISKRSLDSSISIDLSHVGLVVDEDLCYRNTSMLAAKAQEAGLEMMVSMEGSERTEQVLGIYRSLSEHYPNVGITLQVCLPIRSGDPPCFQTPLLDSDT
jgi:proline dehydrogenase